MSRTDLPPRGTLSVVALPIGNSADLTPRALQVLADADVVAAEDTRTVGRFLASLGVKARLISYHDWNEAQRADTLAGLLEEGRRVALVSEAGTPGISDPGFDLVRLARRRGFPVQPIPGACAAVAFLSAAGLPTNRFTFVGFPPRTGAKRRALFQELAPRMDTLVFYESPHRIQACLEDAADVFGARECALVREMTKPHEEWWYGPLTEVRDRIAALPHVRGEVCWGVGAGEPPVEEASAEDLESAARTLLEQGLKPREAARILARDKGISSKYAYGIITARKGAGAS